MKKTITTIVLALGSSGASAQISPVVSNVKPTPSQQLEEPKQQTPFIPSFGTRAGGGAASGIQSFGDTIFTETFSNGLSGDPGNGSWTNAGNANWEYRGPNTTPDITEGSVGAYSGVNLTPPANFPIYSPTQSNGFMIFDSDYLDNGGNTANMGMGPNPTPHRGELESPSIDFSAYSSIYMGFSSYFRRFRGIAYTVFSTDGGITWPDTLEIYGNTIETNSGTFNPENEFHILPSSVTNSSNVKVRFVFAGDTLATATNLTGYYYWMIDDVIFVEAPDNDLALEEVYIGSTVPLFPEFQANNYYGRVPAYQLSQEQFNFGAKINNNGLQSQSGSKAELYINQNKVTETSNSTIAPGNSDSLGMNGTVSLSYPPGSYYMSFVAASNNPPGFPGNDSINQNLFVTDSTYSWVPEFDVGSIITFSVQSQYSIGTIHDLNKDDTVTSFEFYVPFDNDSFNLPNVTFYLWEIGQGSITPTAQTQNISITPSMHGQWNTFSLPAPQAVSPGRYLIGVDVASGPLYWAEHGSNHGKGFTLYNMQGSGWSLLNWADVGAAPAIAIGINLKGADCQQHNAQTTINNPAGCGLSDGSVTVVPNDPNVSILWPDNTTGQTNNNLASGTYNVTLHDSICSSVIQVIVPNQNAPQPINGGLEITKEISANFVNAQEAGNLSLATDAEIAANFTGGAPPYQYAWQHSGDTTQSSTETGLGAGSQYRVTVIDNNNCEGISQTVSITPPPIMTVSIDTTRLPGFQTELTAQVQNGTPSYSYQWNDPGNSTSQSITVDNTIAYTYRVTITDSVGAQAGATDITGDSVVFVGCSSISMSFHEVPASCNVADGELLVNVQGGTPPYSYNWSSGGSSYVESNLSGGAYYAVTVTDFNGCTIVDSASVSEVDAPDVTITIDNPISCFGNSDGQIFVGATGGQPPYTYSWSNNAQGDTLDNLSAGTYTVTVEDDVNCSAVELITLISPPQLDTGVTITNDGATAEASLDTAGANYTWYNCGSNSVVSGENSASFTPANDGSYRLIIELGGCTDSSSCFTLITTSVGDMASDEFNMNIYPNPNNGLFNVRLTGRSDKSVQLQILDIQGKQLLNRNLGILSGELTEELNLNLAGGIYLVKVIRDGNISVDRLVIQ